MSKIYILKFIRYKSIRYIDKADSIHGLRTLRNCSYWSYVETTVNL